MNGSGGIAGVRSTEQSRIRSHGNLRFPLRKASGRTPRFQMFPSKRLQQPETSGGAAGPRTEVPFL